MFALKQKLQKITEKIAELTAALTKQSSPTEYLERGSLYYFTENYALALKDAEQSISLLNVTNKEKITTAYILKCLAAGELQQYETAEAAGRKAVESMGNNPMAWQALRYAVSRAGYSTEPLLMCDMAIFRIKNPQFSAADHALLVKCEQLQEPVSEEIKSNKTKNNNSPKPDEKKTANAANSFMPVLTKNKAAARVICRGRGGKKKIKCKSVSTKIEPLEKPRFPFDKPKSLKKEQKKPSPSQEKNNSSTAVVVKEPAIAAVNKPTVTVSYKKIIANLAEQKTSPATLPTPPPLSIVTDTKSITVPVVNTSPQIRHSKYAIEQFMNSEGMARLPDYMEEDPSLALQFLCQIREQDDCSLYNQQIEFIKNKIIPLLSKVCLVEKTRYQYWFCQLLFDGVITSMIHRLLQTSLFKLLLPEVYEVIENNSKTKACMHQWLANIDGQGKDTSRDEHILNICASFMALIVDKQLPARATPFIRGQIVPVNLFLAACQTHSAKTLTVDEMTVEKKQLLLQKIEERICMLRGAAYLQPVVYLQPIVSTLPSPTL